MLVALSWIFDSVAQTPRINHRHASYPRKSIDRSRNRKLETQQTIHLRAREVNCRPINRRHGLSNWAKQDFHLVRPINRRIIPPVTGSPGKSFGRAAAEPQRAAESAKRGS